jgi:Family of unknown function (DUF5681)
MTDIDPTSVPPADAVSSPASAANEQVEDGSAAAAVAAAEQSPAAAVESPSPVAAEQPAEDSDSTSNVSSAAPAEQSAAPAIETPPLVAADLPAEDLTPSTIAPDESEKPASDSTPAACCGEMNGQKPRGRPFAPGQSGNALGRPRGSRNRATQAVEALVEGQAEALVAKALEKALAGDSNLLRALCSTLLPGRPDRMVEFDLPKIETAADGVVASSAVLMACGRGEISPSVAGQVMDLIATHVRTIDVAAFEQRLTALEENLKKQQAPSSSDENALR